MMVLMILAWLLVIAALVAGVWWLTTVMRHSRRSGALDILRECYARGEISREEFESRRRDPRHSSARWSRDRLDRTRPRRRVRDVLEDPLGR
jgi:hypothetical protein